MQRTDGDPLLFDVVYHGSHTCAQAQHQGAAAAHPGGGNQGAQTASPGLLEAAAGPVLPFSLPSNVPAAGADDAGGSRLPGGGAGARATASPFVSPATTPECLARGDVPHHDAELDSTTNSPMTMAEMDFMFPLGTADFLENPDSYF